MLLKNRKKKEKTLAQQNRNIPTISVLFFAPSLSRSCAINRGSGQQTRATCVLPLPVLPESSRRKGSVATLCGK